MLREEIRGEGRVPADMGRALACVRASNMQVMRLQLAAERQDRRGVMAAIDELVDIDRELERLIGPAPDIADQRREMMAERVVLARGKLGPALAPVPLDLPPEFAEPEDEAPPRARWPWVAGLVAVCTTAAVGAWLALGGTETLLAWQEALR